MSSPSGPPAFELPKLTRAQKVATMIGTLLGLLLAALDQTIVATAGPAIQHNLHIAPSLYVWITTAYLVASTVLVPVWGKLSDLYGRRLILISGMSIFLIGSVLCGVAQSTVQLIVFRAVQGVGSASLFTTAFAVVADMFAPAERGKYQGIYGGVFALSSVVGPLAGGFITDHWSWHWVFFVNVPIGIIALGFVSSRMPALRRPRTGPANIDLLGVAALIVAMVPLLLALSLGKSAHAHTPGYAWTSWQILGGFAIAAAGMVAFVLIERRATDPILDLRLFRDRVFAVGNGAAFVVGMSFLGAIVFLPLFMVFVVGLSKTNSGLTTTPLTFGIVIGNIASGQIVSRIGRYKPVLLASLVILVTAFAIMGFTLSIDATQGGVTLKMVLLGLGLGPSIPLFTLAIQNAVPPRQIGVATATATFSRQMGATIGVAILGTVFATALSSGMHDRMAAGTKTPPAVTAPHAQAPQFAEASEGSSGGGGFFDAGAARKGVNAKFDGLEAQARKAGNPAQVAELEHARAGALAGIAAQDHAAKLALTDAISQLYRLCMVIASLGLIVTLALPERPLRRASGPVAIPAVE